MSWAVGWDANWHRDIGYGVPATCDHPGCTERIDRGLAHVCAGNTPYGGDGCGLYFCSQHQNWRGFCERCQRGLDPFDATPDLPEWVRWKLTDESWARWRDENPEEVAAMRAASTSATDSEVPRG